MNSVEIGSVMFIHYLRALRMSTCTFHTWEKFDTENPHLMQMSSTELRETPSSDSRISLKYVNEFYVFFGNVVSDLSEIRCKSFTEHLWFSWKSVQQWLYFSNGRKWSYTDVCFAKLYGILKAKHTLKHTSRIWPFVTLLYSPPSQLGSRRFSWNHVMFMSFHSGNFSVRRF